MMPRYQFEKTKKKKKKKIAKLSSSSECNRIIESPHRYGEYAINENKKVSSVNGFCVGWVYFVFFVTMGQYGMLVYHTRNNGEFFKLVAQKKVALKK